MRKMCLIVASLVSLTLSGSASADPVDNPGPFNLAFDSGSLVIGSLAPFIISSLTVSGSILETSGSLLIPIDAIVLPDSSIEAPIIGTVIVHFEPLQDATGTLNALTGDMTSTLAFRVHLINPFLPADCGVSPDPLNLTSGTDGALTGIPYSSNDGTVTLVNNSFGVPRSTGCGLFAGAIDNAIGLPSPPGNNSLDQLHGMFDTIFVGS